MGQSLGALFLNFIKQLPTVLFRTTPRCSKILFKKKKKKLIFFLILSIYISKHQTEEYYL